MRRQDAKDAKKDRESEGQRKKGHVGIHKGKRGEFMTGSWDEFHGRRRVEPPTEIDELAYRVIGAAIEVHRILGPGHLESVYRDALFIELGLRGIPVEREVAFDVDYKGHPVGSGRLDLFVDRKLVLELKACEGFTPVHKAKVISYLRCTKRPLALLINFNVAVLHDGIRRVVNSDF
jgi:GxxExxY protein